MNIKTAIDILIIGRFRSSWIPGGARNIRRKCKYTSYVKYYFCTCLIKRIYVTNDLCSGVVINM